MLKDLSQVSTMVRQVFGKLIGENRSRRQISIRDLLPLVVMLPLVTYACLFQMVVCHRSEHDEYLSRLRYLHSLVNRLETSTQDDRTTCRDYAHWTELYDQMPRVTQKWLEINIDTGICSSFGFDIVTLDDMNGSTVRATGVDKGIRRDIEKYCRSARKIKDLSQSGLIQLDGNAYTFTAVAIRRSDHSGDPRGILFVARKITPAFLDKLMGSDSPELAFVEKSGKVVAVEHLGPAAVQPLEVKALLAGDTDVRKPFVKISSDGLRSYACAPILDIKRKPVGVLVDVTSRVGYVSSARALRRMSLALAVLCLLIALSASLYLRTRDTAIRAHRDELTGLYNHRYLQERLKSELYNAGRMGQALSVIMLDIDHFKVVNDTYGHSVGDAVLKTISQVIINATRQTDVVARYGGEEFVVVLPGTSLKGALMVGERLRQNAQACIVKSQSREAMGSVPLDVQFTISAGVATYPEDAATAASLVEAADTAMAAAKRPRNMVMSYKETLNAMAYGDTSNGISMDGFLRDPSLMVVRPLVAAIDTREPGSANHSENTARYAVEIGRELGLSTQDLSLTCRAALLHDVGKIGIPDDVLSKEGKLTQEELKAVKDHSKLGADILSRSPLLAPAADIVLHHHERHDGKGYPAGISGEDIPLIARIVSVADSVDAMISSRVYKERKTLQQALDEVINQSGRQFDPEVVKAAEKVLTRMIRTSVDTPLAA